MNNSHADKKFASELATFFEVKNCFLFSSGAAALTVLLRVLHEIRPSCDEVVIPAFTCNTVPSAIFRAGLKMRLCDIDPITLDFNLNELTKCIEGSDKILCILPTHLFGIPSDIESVKGLADKKQIPVIEDAAQAMGTRTSNGKLLGTLADASIISFARGKPFTTLGGGALLTNNELIAKYATIHTRAISCPGFFPVIVHFVMSLLYLILLKPSFFWIPRKIPFLRFGITPFDMDFKLQKMCSFQAAIAQGWQKELDLQMNIRIKNSKLWAESALKNYTKIKIPESLPLVRYPLLCITSQTAEYLVNQSQKKGLGISLTYENVSKTFKYWSVNCDIRSFSGAQKCQENLTSYSSPAYGRVV